MNTGLEENFSSLAWHNPNSIYFVPYGPTVLYYSSASFTAPQSHPLDPKCPLLLPFPPPNPMRSLLETASHISALSTSIFLHFNRMMGGFSSVCIILHTTSITTQNILTNLLVSCLFLSLNGKTLEDSDYSLKNRLT